MSKPKHANPSLQRLERNPHCTSCGGELTQVLVQSKDSTSTTQVWECIQCSKQYKNAPDQARVPKKKRYKETVRTDDDRRQGNR